MVKQILVCLEGSLSGARAVDVAIGLARGLGAGLVGLAIVDEPDIRAGQPTGIGGSAFKAQRDDALVADAQEKAAAWLEAFAVRCRDAGVPASTLGLTGRPAAMILDETKRHDLTILGRHANFRFETEDGDVKTRETILRQAGKPVVMVPEEIVESGSAVLAAFDGTQPAVRALRALADSGLARDREVHVASVGDDGQTAYEMAERGCAILRGLGIEATAHNIVSTLSVAESLLERRAKLNAGLLVQGAYTRSRFSRLLWGSVTSEMLDKTVVPLFLHY